MTGFNEFLAAGVSDGFLSGTIGRREAMQQLGVLGGALASGPGAARGRASSAVERQGGIDVTSMGAAGDGSRDDTAAFHQAIGAAAVRGAAVVVPAGVYVLDSVPVTSVAHLRLAEGATLRHKGGASAAMFRLTGTRLTLQGGTVDGNKENQTQRVYLVTGGLQAGKSIELEDVHFRGTVGGIAYATEFGGMLSMEHCRVTEQAEHSGAAGQATFVLVTITGEEGGEGHVRFNHNVCIGTASPAVPGGNPGGIFLATNGYVPGRPGSEGFAHGNRSTLEAIGNYFWWYGQHTGGNDISPIHTYPTIGGARIIGNYFEKCGFCAISAKSVQDFVCTGNVVVDGLVSSQNVASEGAISYVPGYQAANVPRPRAVIAGNLVSNPGGQPNVRQNGITVSGLPESHADQVVIANNVLSGCGRGIQVSYCDDIVVSGNLIDGPAGDETHASAQDGIRLDYCYGTVKISGNTIRTAHGHGLFGVTGLGTARVHVSDNYFDQASAAHYATTLRGVAFISLSGNTYDAAGTALSLTASGTTKIEHLHVGDNAHRAGALSLDFASIRRVTGKLRYAADPVGRVTPGEIGTVYCKTNGGEADALFVALGPTAADWAPLLTTGRDAAVPSVALGTGSGSAAACTLTGNDAEGVLEIVTGRTPAGAGSTVATITFAGRRGAAPKAVLLSPANAKAATRQNDVFVPRSALRSTSWTMSNAMTALDPAAVYQWYYRVL